MLFLLPGGGSPFLRHSVFLYLCPGGEEWTVGRKDLPARGAQKDGHPWDTLRIQCRVACPALLCPESKSGIQLPQHVGTRSADAAIFNNESDLQSLKRFQTNAGEFRGPSVSQKLEFAVHGTDGQKCLNLTFVGRAKKQQ